MKIKRMWRILTPQYGKFDWFNIFNIGEIFPHEHYQVTWLKRNRISWGWFTDAYCCWLDVCFVNELVNMPYMDPKKEHEVLLCLKQRCFSPNYESAFEHAFSSDEQIVNCSISPCFDRFITGFFNKHCFLQGNHSTMEHWQVTWRSFFQKLQADSSTLVAFKGWWSETRAD